MREYRLTESELKFAEIIWTNEPISSMELVKLCEDELCWKKSTTYTMLKRLLNKAIFENKDSIVTSLLTSEEYYAEQSKQFVNDSFDGSLPRFLTAFTRNKKLSDKEITDILQLISENGEVK